MNDTPSRNMLSLGTGVMIIQKQDQRTGKLTEGKIKRILTSSKLHPHGIKVELEDGKIGRVQNII
ncbi:MAG: YwbE family protein [Nitrosopumilus sp.]|nr:YwbE family protein [Nitrosopumilus sp.]MDC1103817.1 YwbE family protein [Nitrosopumilus sp.]MDO7696989.1 YwbE family protein [Nitrosopumilus sp.]